MMNMEYGLFVLKKEKEKLENNIEAILDDCHPHVKDEEMKTIHLRRYNEELMSINLTIETIENILKEQNK